MDGDGRSKTSAAFQSRFKQPNGGVRSMFASLRRAAYLQRCKGTPSLRSRAAAGPRRRFASVHARPAASPSSHHACHLHLWLRGRASRARRAQPGTKGIGCSCARLAVAACGCASVPAAFSRAPRQRCRRPQSAVRVAATARMAPYFPGSAAPAHLDGRCAFSPTQRRRCSRPSLAGGAAAGPPARRVAGAVWLLGPCLLHASCHRALPARAWRQRSGLSSRRHSGPVWPLLL